jgi:hypothetical protein
MKRATSALLHYFIPLGAQEPVNGALHFVSGKIASIDSSEDVGMGFSPTEYDFIIDADIVSDCPPPNVLTPILFSSFNLCLKTLPLVQCLLSL